MPIVNYAPEICILNENVPVEYATEWTLSASSTAVGFPVTSVINDSVGIVWKSNPSATAQWVEGNYTGPLTGENVDSVCVVGMDRNGFGEASTMRIQLWDLSVVKYDNTVNLYNMHTAIRVIESIRPYVNRAHYFGRHRITRWRLTFTDPSATGSTYWSIGKVYVTEKFRPQDNFEVGGAQLRSVDMSRFEKSYGNNPNIDARPKQRGMTVSIPMIRHNDDIGEWLRLLCVTGLRKPVWLDAHPNIPEVTFYDEVPAYFNNLWQFYGYMANNVSLARHTDGLTVVGGRMEFEEAL